VAQTRIIDEWQERYIKSLAGKLGRKRPLDESRRELGGCSS
jgi:hypothetical protein